MKKNQKPTKEEYQIKIRKRMNEVGRISKMETYPLKLTKFGSYRESSKGVTLFTERGFKVFVPNDMIRRISMSFRYKLHLEKAKRRS